MPFKGCLSDACVLMKIERFVLKPLRKIERFVLKQHTFRFADYKSRQTRRITQYNFFFDIYTYFFSLTNISIVCSFSLKSLKNSLSWSLCLSS